MAEVLVIEDLAEVRNIFTEFCKLHGEHDLIFAQNNPSFTKSALDLFDEKGDNIILIFIDIELFITQTEKENGIDIAEQILKKQPNQIIYIISGCPDSLNQAKDKFGSIYLNQF